VRFIIDGQKAQDPPATLRDKKKSQEKKKTVRGEGKENLREGRDVRWMLQKKKKTIDR